MSTRGLKPHRYCPCNRMEPRDARIPRADRNPAGASAHSNPDRCRAFSSKQKGSPTYIWSFVSRSLHRDCSRLTSTSTSSRPAGFQSNPSRSQAGVDSRAIATHSLGLRTSPWLTGSINAKSSSNCRRARYRSTNELTKERLPWAGPALGSSSSRAAASFTSDQSRPSDCCRSRRRGGQRNG
jgi:hypothetical protein